MTVGNVTHKAFNKLADNCSLCHEARRRPGAGPSKAFMNFSKRMQRVGGDGGSVIISTTTKTTAMTAPPPPIRHDDDEIHWSGEENARLDSLACYVIRAVLFVLFSLVTPRVTAAIVEKGGFPRSAQHRNP
ncbi:uncharacterized protein LOC121591992 isoform X2 [Anopheles merus]|uniref:uncharacterized protein LOC121591992 isoform X2 n=1 Tax=Anopheles merus TaxID=30066 RepID=UPI001BE3F326|nr:uncharacterized protein LOC121591992 isoform X2 [Anopheles merus]